MTPDGFIEHRRPDGELVGWLRAEGEGFVAVDLLGRERSGALDWLAGEALLEELGLRYLAEAYVLRLDDGRELRVRIVEVSPERIVVKKDDLGDIGAPVLRFELAWPMPAELTLLGDRDDVPIW